jgi:hypothetical protein
LIQGQPGFPDPDRFRLPFPFCLLPQTFAFAKRLPFLVAASIAASRFRFTLPLCG